jgi:YidC/Oxa1 family membrane protein insertase
MNKIKNLKGSKSSSTGFIVLIIFISIASLFLFKNSKKENKKIETTQITRESNKIQPISITEYKSQIPYLQNENVKLTIDLKKLAISSYIINGLADKKIEIIKPEDSALIFGLYNKNNDEIITLKQENWTVKDIINDKNGYVNSVLLENKKDQENITIRLSIESLPENLSYITAKVEKDNLTNDNSTSLYSKLEINITEKYKTDNNSVVHNGMVGFVNNKIIDLSSDDIKKKNQKFDINNSDWIGYTDRYNMIIFQPQNRSQENIIDAKKDRFLTTSQYARGDFFDGQKVNYTILPANSELIKIYIDSKTVEKLDKYKKYQNLPMFERILDYGIFYVITKPMSSFLHKIYQYVGDYGLAIIILTIVIRLITLPMSHMSYSSMNKMKLVQPEMEILKKKYKDDKSGMQKATLELYRKHKINPLSGCLPILLQIPIFFSIYKVIYITNEMRFEKFLWITDLSVKDPTSLFNLFGLINYNLPEFLIIGIMPIIMGITMLIQQKIMPNNMVSSQYANQKLLTYGMPIIFTVMFASFPAGLVLYWTINNIFGIIHQGILKYKNK